MNIVHTLACLITSTYQKCVSLSVPYFTTRLRPEVGELISHILIHSV